MIPWSPIMSFLYKYCFPPQIHVMQLSIPVRKLFQIARTQQRFPTPVVFSQLKKTQQSPPKCIKYEVNEDAREQLLYHLFNPKILATPLH